jgi:trehalose/maltose transport system substrate-binding protein
MPPLADQNSTGRKSHLFCRYWELTLLAILLFFSLFWASCRRQVQQPGDVILALVDRGWFNKEFRDLRDRQYREFNAETGIKVKLLPGPESAVEQLRLWRRLLGEGPERLQTYPDVFGIDVIWPGILADDLVDLKPYVAQDISAYFPELVANWTVNGRLIALPSRLDIGLLYYRTDLLRRYGYNVPPKTWGDLEKMAARIQSGERAKGNKNFWGFVWQGAVSEALTCNALEWQASEGGGRIIDANEGITVNNARAVGAWERAARWVGSISPSGVTTYKEQDAMNVWLSGGAAFMRNWQAAYVVSGSDTSPVKNKFDVTLLPRGQAGRAEVFGGDGYSVSRRSPHLKEAIALVRYLCRRNVEILQSRVLSTPPTMPELYENSDLLKNNPHFKYIQQALLEGLVARPSTVTGRKYIEVSEAFSKAVHSVLVKEKSGPTAAAELEDQLARITGFKRLSQNLVPPKTRSAPDVAQ